LIRMIFAIAYLMVVTISGCFLSINGASESSFSSSRAEIHLQKTFHLTDHCLLVFLLSNKHWLKIPVRGGSFQMEGGFYSNIQLYQTLLNL
jgi:hypothetical protein